MFALLLAACSSDASPTAPAPLTQPLSATLPPRASLTFMAGFKPQANLPFVAAYIAQEKGYFAAENLDVTIRHAQTGEHLKLLLANEIDVSTADAGSVLKRRSDPEAPIKAIALFGQKGQNAYIALQKSGIKTVKDWEGKTFGYKTSVPPEYLAMVKAASADRSRIKEVRVGFDVRILTEGQVDLLAVFKSNEPNLVQKLGFPVTVFDPEDVGVPTLGLSYIVTDKALAEKRDALQRFVRATLRGLAFAKANEEAALDIVMKYAPMEDREHQRFMLRQELRDAEGPVAAANGLGAMSDAQWKALYDELIAYQALPQPFDYRTAYDPTLVLAAYTGNRLTTPP